MLNIHSQKFTLMGKAGMMPPKGGATASDEDVKAAVDYMAAASQ